MRWAYAYCKHCGSSHKLGDLNICPSCGKEEAWALGIWGWLGNFFLLIALVMFFSSSDLDAETIEKLRLDDYVALASDSREDVLAFLIDVDETLDEDDLEHYVDCVGEYAPIKSRDLALVEVFDWCAAEARRAEDKPALRKRFESHRNNLEDIDNKLQITAKVICENRQRDRDGLSSAVDFSHDVDFIAKGNGRFLIKSFYEYGPERYFFNCDIQYLGGDEFSDDSWRLHRLFRAG